MMVIQLFLRIVICPDKSFCINLKKIQHTPGTYPRYSKSPKMKDFLHKQVKGFKGMFQGSVGILGDMILKASQLAYKIGMFFPDSSTLLFGKYITLRAISFTPFSKNKGATYSPLRTQVISITYFVRRHEFSFFHTQTLNVWCIYL